MTNKELHEEINCLKTKLAELEEKITALPKRTDGGIFRPENGQKYWFVSGLGGVYRNTWNNDPTDHNYCAIGNCYQTRQAAEDAVRVLKLIQKARETQNGFVPDCENVIEIKYALYFDWFKRKVCVMNYRVLEIASIFGYWEDKSMCDRFIDDNYDELIWFFTEYRR